MSRVGAAHKDLVVRYHISDQIYKLLKSQIVEGFLKPGQEISIDEIAKMYSVSKTPVREALHYLEGRGLIVKNGTGKLFVVSLSPQDVLQVCELRKMIEVYALERSFNQIPREKVIENLETLKKAKEKLDEGDPTFFYQADTDFHSMIFQYGDNYWLERVVFQLRELIEITRKLFPSLERFQLSLEEHVAIVESLLEGDKEKTVKELGNHLESVKLQLLNAFQERQELEKNRK